MFSFAPPGVFANVPLEALEGNNRIAMVRQDIDGSNIGVATAECFRTPDGLGNIACLGQSASEG